MHSSFCWHACRYTLQSPAAPSRLNRFMLVGASVHSFGKLNCASTTGEAVAGATLAPLRMARQSYANGLTFSRHRFVKITPMGFVLSVRRIANSLMTPQSCKPHPCIRRPSSARPSPKVHANSVTLAATLMECPTRRSAQVRHAQHWTTHLRCTASRRCEAATETRRQPPVKVLTGGSKHYRKDHTRCQSFGQWDPWTR